MKEDAIVFQIVDWHSYHRIDSTGTNHYVIQLYGRTIDDRDVCLKVTGFRPFFYAEIPEKWEDHNVDEFIKAVKKKASYMAGKSEHFDYDASNELVEWSIFRRQTFGQFENGKRRKMVLLQFSSHTAMKLYGQALSGEVKIGYGEGKKFERYESNMDPLLRFMHIQDLEAVGWVKVMISDMKHIPEYSACDLTYSIRFSDVKPCVMENQIAPFKIMGYDIECVSNDHNFPRADRITDKITQIGFTIYRYGSLDCEDTYMLTLKKCAKIEGAHVYCYKNESSLIKGFADIMKKIRPEFRTGYNIFGFDDEYIWKRAVRLDEARACKLGIQYHQLENKLCDYLLNNLSRVNHEYVQRTENIRTAMTTFETTRLSSSGLGDNLLKYFNIPGTVSIDMFKVIQTGQYGLTSLSLDSVSATFIREKIVSITRGDDMHITINTNSTRALDPESFVQIVVSDGYDISPLVVGAKYFVTNVMPKSFDIKIPSEDVDALEIALKSKGTNWTFAKDDMPYDMIKKHFEEGNPKHIQTIAKYCIKDCKLTNLLIAKLDVIVNGVGMANVCNVPLSYLFRRGQGVKIFSLVGKKCLRKGIVIPLLSAKDNTVNTKYEGATVIRPKPDIYRDPIVILDYNSLYPRCMQEFNGSPDCYVSDKRYDNCKGYVYHDVFVKEKDELKRYIYNLDGTHKITHHRFAQKIVTDADVKQDLKVLISVWEERIEEAKTRKRLEEGDLIYVDGETGSRIKESQRCEIIDGLTCDYAQALDSAKGKIYNTYKGVYVKYGILPEVLCDLLGARAEVQAMMGKETDASKRAVLNGRQLTLKVTANSVYGQTGYSKSAIYFKPVAESTTALGRERLYLAKRLVEENFPGSEVIYGDTDSIFINFHLKDENGVPMRDKEGLARAIQLGRDAAALINNNVPKPQKIVYEKSMFPLIIIAMKKYAGMLYESDVNKCFLKVMGIMLKRRDNAPIAKIVVGTTLDSILALDPIESTIDKTRKMLDKMMSGHYGIDKYTTSKTLRSHYAKPKSIAHKVLADRMAERDPGNKPKPNDRIFFVHIVKNTDMCHKKKLLQGEFIENPEQVIAGNMEIDYLHYLENQIINPASQFLGLAVSQKTLDKFFGKYIIAEKNRRRGARSIQEWLTTPLPEKQLVIEPKKESLIKYIDGTKKLSSMSMSRWMKQ